MISIDGLNSLFRGKATWLVERSEAQPTLTCGNCRAPVDVPSDRELNDYEFCERQSVLWAERAMKAKR